MRSRRNYLATTSIILSITSGCLGTLSSTDEQQNTATTRRDSDYDGVPDEEDEFPNNAAVSETVLETSETIQLAPGSHEAYQINTNKPGSILYSAISDDGQFDVLFFDQEDYNRYTSDDTGAEYRTVLSDTNTSAASTEQLLPEGDWVFVIDHTTWETAPNPNPIEVDVSLEVRIQENSES